MALRGLQERCEGWGALGGKGRMKKVKDRILRWETRFRTNQNLGTSSVANQSAEFALLINNGRKSIGFSQ